MKNRRKEQINNILFIIAGVFIEACAVSIFVLPNDILTGGIAGVAVALKPVLAIEPVWIINFMTVSLYFLGFLTQGKQFALKTLVATFSYTISITALSFVMKLLPSNLFIMPDYLAVIYAGIFIGIGLGLVFRANASTGGMDVLALILSKLLKIRSGNAVVIVDALTVALGIFTYGIVPALTGILSVFICGQVVNKILMLHTEASKEILIISQRWEEIQEYLLKRIDRGVTYWKGQGGYTGQEKTVLMCVIKQSQYSQIEKDTLQIDPLAFIIISDVHQVQGEGFTFLQEQRMERMKLYEERGNRIS